MIYLLIIIMINIQKYKEASLNYIKINAIILMGSIKDKSSG